MKALYFLKLYLYFIIDIHANDIKGQTALQEPLQETVVPDPPGIPAIRRPPFLNSCNRTGLCPGLGQRGNDQVVDTPQVGLLWGVGTDTETLTFPKQSDRCLCQRACTLCIGIKASCPCLLCGVGWDSCLVHIEALFSTLCSHCCLWA